MGQNPLPATQLNPPALASGTPSGVLGYGKMKISLTTDMAVTERIEHAGQAKRQWT